MKKRLVILGSTGSIGRSALQVVASLGDRFEVVGLAARRNGREAVEQARRFGVGTLAVGDPEGAEEARRAAPDLRVLEGAEGLTALAAMEGIDMVLCAVVGMAGLQPVLAALARGTDVALATKEVLVGGGAVVIEAARRSGARLVPVDSEHSAIYQCLNGCAPSAVRRLVLTASGGPFAGRPTVDFDRVTVAEALRHPRWNMGRKISVDSATLMNKGLEIIEAHWLFAMPLDRIGVVIHPESIVHSVVEFVDGSMLAQMGPTDMRFAIQYAFTCPERVDGGLEPLDLARLGALHFAPPDEARFPCLRLAREAAAAGGTCPVALNAANETAVERFLAGGLAFSAIWATIEEVLSAHRSVERPTLADILAADRAARQGAEEACRRHEHLHRGSR